MHFRTKAHARDFLERLLSGDTPTKAEAAILMSEYSAWVTWDEDGKTADPFRFARTAASADLVRASLGLDPQNRMKGKPLLLFVYSSHSGLDLFRPTIADAGLHRFFEPPPIGNDDYGLTKTWPPAMAKSLPTLLPRPEAIHSPIAFEHLAKLDEIT
jgi:hypothetical protein